MIKKISAIYDDDLEDFLKSIGEYQNVIKQRCRCKFCSDVISIENIAQILPESGSVKFVCNKHKCIIKATEIGAR